MKSVSLATIHRELQELQKDLSFVKSVIAEDYELSDEAKKELAEARRTPKEKYISEEHMVKEFL